MNDLDLPDLSGHPPPPKLTFEQYQRWVCEENDFSEPIRQQP